MTREQLHAKPGQPWPIGSWCPRDVDEFGQSWVNPPRCTCEACAKTFHLGAHVPKKLPAACPKCGAAIETTKESPAA